MLMCPCYYELEPVQEYCHLTTRQTVTVKQSCSVVQMFHIWFVRVTLYPDSILNADISEIFLKHHGHVKCHVSSKCVKAPKFVIVLHARL